MAQCQALNQILEVYPYGEHIRHIKGNIRHLLSIPEFPNILRKAVNLLSLQGMPEESITCDDLSVISILAGKTLRFLDVAIKEWRPSSVDWLSLSVSIWGLRHLTMLVWSGEGSFDPKTMNGPAFRGALPSLTTLIYTSKVSTFMDLLCYVE